MSSLAFPCRALDSLPVELLYEIQLFALSEHIPHTCHRLHEVYKRAPNSFHAQYILGRFYAIRCPKPHSIVTRSLRYPLCSKDILASILRHPDCPSIITSKPHELPKRFFRSLLPRARGKVALWDEDDEPLPFLRYLYHHTRFTPPDANSHHGYALTKAVVVNFIPLIQFLLHHGASPGCKHDLPVMIAIQRNNLSMVRLLIERGYGEETAKKRRMNDRVQPTAKMLRRAARSDAPDIVKYLVDEKRVVPDMQTIQILSSYGYL